MIKLKIEDYCQECPDFEVDVNKTVVSNLPCKTNTMIRCTNHVRCALLYKHLESCYEEELNKERENV